MLAAELSRGKVDLPSFPDVALRVRKALQDEQVSADKIVRIIGAEPSLAARLIQLANSAGVNAGGRHTTDLRVAIARIGLNLVRSSTIIYAMSQLTKSETLRSVREPLRALWQRSALVAAMASVVARRHTKVNPDTAALAGISARHRQALHPGQRRQISGDVLGRGGLQPISNSCGTRISRRRCSRTGT